MIGVEKGSRPPLPPNRARSSPAYLQLRSLGLLRHGLPPCCLRAFTGALGAQFIARSSISYRPINWAPTAALVLATLLVHGFNSGEGANESLREFHVKP